MSDILFVCPSSPCHTHTQTDVRLTIQNSKGIHETYNIMQNVMFGNRFVPIIQMTSDQVSSDKLNYTIMYTETSADILPTRL